MREDERLWAEWCFYLTPKKTIDKEDIFSQKVVTLFEKMGWSQFDGEMELERSIPVGSNQKIRSDILLHKKESKETIVIELKQPSIQFSDAFRKQLFSYMRQIRSNVGMLIGSEIEYYYDPPTAIPNSQPELLFTISLKNEENFGPAFVRIMTKANFGTDEYKSELDKLAKKYSERLKHKKTQLPHPLTKKNPQISSIQPSGYKGTEQNVLDIINTWQKTGMKKTPWGHNLVSKGQYSQAALIDACLCIDGGMSRERIAQNSGVTPSRVSGHIDNDLKTGKRNKGKAAIIKSKLTNGEICEYIEPQDQKV